MHERPGPQYNRGNDPTTGVCILKNATQKKWYLRFWNIFFFILRWRAESPVVFSGVTRGGAGESGAPLVLDQKEARRAEKNFFLRPGPPFISESGWPNPTPPPHLKVWIRYWSYWVGMRNGGSVWIASNLYSRSLELAARTCEHTFPEAWKMYPFRAELQCIGHYRAGVHPGFQTKTAQNLYPFPGWENPSLQKAHRKNKPVPIRLVKWS